MALEFDRILSIHRALGVGALNHILPPENLRPFLIHAIERGIASELKMELEKANSETPKSQPDDDYARREAS